MLPIPSQSETKAHFSFQPDQSVLSQEKKEKNWKYRQHYWPSSFRPAVRPQRAPLSAASPPFCATSDDGGPDALIVVLVVVTYTDYGRGGIGDDEVKLSHFLPVFLLYPVATARAPNGGLRKKRADPKRNQRERRKSRSASLPLLALPGFGNRWSSICTADDRVKKISFGEFPKPSHQSVLGWLSVLI